MDGHNRLCVNIILNLSDTEDGPKAIINQDTPLLDVVVPYSIISIINVYVFVS